MSEKKPQVLLLDDDPFDLASLRESLAGEGYEVTATTTLDEALAAFAAQSFDAIISDVRLPKGSGFDLLQHVRDIGAGTAVILFTGYGTIEDAVRAIKMGAFDYRTKPHCFEEARLCLERAVQHRRLLDENRQLRERLNMTSPLDNFLCRDARMRRVLDTIKTVADTNTSILITGESGTGKTLVSRYIHHHSPRHDKPFVEVNCGALPDTLLESELFGHTKGAFSGAIANKVGKFEVADGGTIFLDEIGNASPQFQMKLLRVLESFAFEPVGGNRTRKVNVRVILATNQDLAGLVADGKFREDLYYRVNVVNIYLAPLRERVDDIPILARHFLEKFAAESPHGIKGFSDEVMRILTAYKWPGNVRELENVVQRAVVLCNGDYVTADVLPHNMQPGEPVEEQESGIMNLSDAMALHEKRIIEETLRTVDGSRQDTAKRLGINRTTLYNKMKRYGLEDA